MHRAPDPQRPGWLGVGGLGLASGNVWLWTTPSGCLGLTAHPPLSLHPVLPALLPERSVNLGTGTQRQGGNHPLPFRKTSLWGPHSCGGQGVKQWGWGRRESHAQTNRTRTPVQTQGYK